MNNTDTPTIPSNTTDTATTTDSMMQSTAGKKMRDNNNDNTANTTTTTTRTKNTTTTTTTNNNINDNEKKRTEQEKMLAGELYLAMDDPTLRHDRNIVKELCYQYNHHTNPTNYQRRSELLYQILPNLPKTNDTTTTTTNYNNNNPNQHETGQQNDEVNQNQPQQEPNIIDITIEAPFYCDYGYNINFTKNCRVFYANHGVTILDCHSITFGHNVFIAPNVCISAATHPTIDPQLRLDGYELAAPIVIRDNVWIGANAFIGPGVTIGTNSVVGAGYVVIRNVPDNVIVAGVPAKIIRTINTNTTNTNTDTATNSNSNSIITTTTTTTSHNE